MTEDSGGYKRFPETNVCGTKVIHNILFRNESSELSPRAIQDSERKEG